MNLVPGWRGFTLGRYVAGLFVSRTLAGLAGLVAILQLLSLLDLANALQERGGLPAIGRFVALRLPTLVAEMLPLAVLVGTTLTGLRLAASLEMSAIRAGGRSLGQVLLMLLPVCAVASGLQFALRTEVMPRAERSFAEWWFRTAPPGSDEAPPRLWLRVAGDVAAVDRVSADGTRLDGVMLLRRDPDGNLLARLDANRASFRDGGWRLEDVRVARVEGGPVRNAAEVDWPQGPAPANMVELARPVNAITFGRLLDTLHGRWIGSRRPAFYRTTLHGLFASLLDPAIMVCLALPAALALPRLGGAAAAATGFALGLGYLVASGLLQSLGGAGWLPPMVAGWGAALVFTIVGVTRMVRADEG